MGQGLGDGVLCVFFILLSLHRRIIRGRHRLSLGVRVMFRAHVMFMVRVIYYGKTQDTRHKTHDTRHKTQDTRHMTQHTTHNTQDSTHNTHDARQKTQGQPWGGALSPVVLRALCRQQQANLSTSHVFLAQCMLAQETRMSPKHVARVFMAFVWFKIL